MTIYFVSGHRNITKDEFEKHYVPQLDEAVKLGDAKFIVGDCMGVDFMAQRYLDRLEQDVTVYHMCETPRFFVSGLKSKGGYTSDFDRDFEMTKNSDVDLTWIRHMRSGTQQNIERRKWMKQRLNENLSITKEDLLKREAENFI